MNSNDVFISINGQTFRIEHDTLRPAENNFQSEVLRRLDGIESRLGVLEVELGYTKHDIANLQTSVYWTLAAIGIFIAALAISSMIASITSAFRQTEAPKEEKVSLTISLTDLLLRGLKAEQSNKGE